MSDEKRYDGSEVLSNVSGLSKEAIRELWEEVKNNSKVLGSCRRPHDFEIDLTMTVASATCKTCGGMMDKFNAMSYMEGLADGKALHE